MITTFYRATIGDLGDVIAEQPHQALISTASVTLIALEAGLVVPPPANIALAVGIEWAFLRGAASARRVATPWATALNWGAAAVLLVYGSLWSLRKFGAIPHDPSLWLAVVLTVLHIVPVFFVALCAAQVHAAMQRADLSRATTTAERREHIDLEIYEAEQKALARQRVKAANVFTAPPGEQRHFASGRAMNSVDTVHGEQLTEQVREQFARLCEQSPGISKSEAARRIGISRTTLYKALKEDEDATA